MSVRSMMNTPDAAIQTMLETIYDTMGEGQYGRAANTAGTLTRLAYQLDSETDMFIGDVLNATCGHFEHVRTAYVAPHAIMEQMHEHLMGLTGALVDAHKENGEVMPILQKIRCAAVSFVLAAEQKYRQRQPDQGR